MIFKEIPQTWLIALLLVCLVAMRFYGIDSFTTAGISLLIGYITGKHIESVRTVTSTEQIGNTQLQSLEQSTESSGIIKFD
jgi:hypothetical protein